MKKLILTGCAAALFCIGSIAQVQDTVNNNLRQGAQETEQETKDAGNELRQGAERTGEQIEQTADSARQDVERTGEQIEQTADSARQGAERTGEQIEQTADSAKQGAERTGEQMQQGVDRAKDQMDSSSQSSPSSNATDMGASAQPPMHEIEVLEDKEGPNNQVVYKYQDGLYYVDREEKKLVKIEESQLKDAEHKAVVKNTNEKQ